MSQFINIVVKDWISWADKSWIVNSNFLILWNHFHLYKIFRQRLLKFHRIRFRMKGTITLSLNIERKNLYQSTFICFESKITGKRIIIAHTSASQHIYKIKRPSVSVKTFTEVWIYITLALRSSLGFWLGWYFFYLDSLLLLVEDHAHKSSVFSSSFVFRSERLYKLHNQEG